MLQMHEATGVPTIFAVRNFSYRNADGKKGSSTRRHLRIQL